MEPAPNVTIDYCQLDLAEAEIPFILVLTLLFNSVSVAVISRMKVLTENVDHVLVTTLTYNDLISTLIFMLMWLGGWMTCGRMLQNVSCDIFGWLGSLTIMWSAGIVVTMSACRYLALVWPLYYRLHVTPKIVKITLIANFVFFVILTIFPLLGLAAKFLYYESNFICAYNFTPADGGLFHRIILGIIAVAGLITISMVLFFNLSIVGQIRKTSSVGHSDKKKKTVLQSKRMTITTVTMVVSLVYCSTYGPFLIRVLTDVINNASHQDSIYHSITMAMLFLSPLLNPVIYVFVNKRNRMCLLDMLKSICYKITCRKLSPGNTSTGTAASHIEGHI